MSYRKYTLEQFQLAINESTSIAQVLIKLELAPKGGNYATANRYIKENNIDISHFKGQGWNKGKTIGPKRPIEDYLNNSQTIQSYKLKARIIKENILPHQCNFCKNTEWLQNPIPLELHHKDGNHENNNLNNLELLCPNCHALTDTYRGKNQDRTKA